MKIKDFLLKTLDIRKKQSNDMLRISDANIMFDIINERGPLNYVIMDEGGTLFTILLVNNVNDWLEANKDIRHLIFCYCIDGREIILNEPWWFTFV